MSNNVEVLVFVKVVHLRGEGETPNRFEVYMEGQKHKIFEYSEVEASFTVAALRYLEKIAPEFSYDLRCTGMIDNAGLYGFQRNTGLTKKKKNSK